MKTLYLVRHSKAVQRKPSLPDFERTLVKSGEKDSLNMAKKIKKDGCIPDLLISSTANRALETAHLFAKGLKYPLEKILVKDSLYNEMSEEALLYIIRQVDDRYNSVMLFGHNPVFTDLASYLIKEFHEDIPKSGIVGIEFSQSEWKAVTPLSGKLVLFEYPKRLAKTYKQLQADLETAMKDKIQEILMRIDPKSAKKEAKLVRQSSQKIADSFIKTLKQTQSREEKRALANEAASRARSSRPPTQTGVRGKTSTTRRRTANKATPTKKTSPVRTSTANKTPTTKRTQAKKI